MRALQLIGDRQLELVDLPDPAAPAEGEVVDAEFEEVDKDKKE